VDIGADESDLRLWRPEPRHSLVVRVAPDGDDANDGATWGHSKRTIQAGINAVSGDGEVWISAGVYHESLSIGGSVRLLGGFIGTEGGADERDPHAHLTAVDADGDSSVIIAAGTTARAVVDGFTIRDGRGALVPATPSARRTGGGIQILDGFMTVSNNIIENNAATDGGGISVGTAAHPAAGVGPLITHNTIRLNTSTGAGGGISVRGAARIRNNRLESNNSGSGGAAAIYVPSALYPVDFTANTVVRNKAMEGAGLWVYGPRIAVSNNLFDGNWSETLGGGIYVSDAASLWNNTVVRGKGSLGGGIFCDATRPQPTLRNNIVALNSSGVWADAGFNRAFANDVFGNTGANFDGPSGDLTATQGNLSADPLFVNPAADDFHLTAHSPCVDAGTAIGNEAMDLDGAPRTVGGSVDIGAYEYQGGTAPPPALDARAALQIAGGLAPGGSEGGEISLMDAVRLAISAAHP
jgi:hypothetical protein